jgi:HK97 gp10 family phage protein
MHGAQGVRGQREHQERLRRLGSQQSIDIISRALFVAGNMVQVEAQQSITRGSVSGRGHVPSRPGEAPNNDTGVLANNIETVLKEPLLCEVSSNAPYSKALELGTSKMAARPFMGPALRAKQDDINKLMVKAVKKALERAGSG